MVDKKKPVLNKNKPDGFRVWESSQLYEIMVKSSQIQHNIETLSSAKQLEISDLGTTDIPISTLYNLCLGYTAIYEKLVKKELIATANLNQHPLIH